MRAPSIRHTASVLFVAAFSAAPAAGVQRDDALPLTIDTLTDRQRTDLDKQRASLEKALQKGAAKIAKTTGTGIVAMIAAHPTRHSALADEVADWLQPLWHQSLQLEGVLAFEYTPVTPVRYDGTGALHGGMLIDKDEAKSLQTKRRADYLLETRLSVTGDKVKARFRCIDLNRLRTAVDGTLPSLSFRKLPAELVLDFERLPPLNQQVLSFAVEHFGETVDRGECWDVPARPLKNAGIRIKGYDFGDEVSFEEALPGDVLTTDSHVMVLTQKGSKLAQSRILHQNVGGKRFIVHGRAPGDGVKIWRPTSAR